MFQPMILNKVLYMGHSVFLSSEQIKNIIEGKEIITDGACVPVIQSPDGSTTEPSGEMITKYLVKVGDSDKIVGDNRRFNISIVKPEELLLPPKGCQMINFSSVNPFTNGKIIHQVIVQPEEILINSWMDLS